MLSNVRLRTPLHRNLLQSYTGVMERDSAQVFLEPGGRPPAPGALALVQDFVNTNDREGRRDDLTTPQRLRRWLTGHGLLEDDAPVSDADLGRALDLRESLRALMLANHGEPLAAEVVAGLNRVASDAPLVVRLDDTGHARLAPAAAGVDGALARLLAIVSTAVVEGTWSRMKACREDVCRWAFYDTSKNRSGAWCSMAVCGNRNKVRAYQRRRRGGQALTP